MALVVLMDENKKSLAATRKALTKKTVKPEDAYKFLRPKKF